MQTIRALKTDDVDNEVGKLKNIIKLLDITASLLGYVVFQNRYKRGLLYGFESISSKLNDRDPYDTFETIVLIPEIFVEKGERIVWSHRHGIIKQPTYVVELIAEHSPARVELFDTGRKKYFRVVKSDKVIVSDTIPPSSLLGWMISPSIKHEKFSQYSSLVEPTNLREILEVAEKTTRSFMEYRQLSGVVTRFTSGDWQVCNHIFSQRLPLDDSLFTVNYVRNTAIYYILTMKLGRITLLNPTEESLNLVSRVEDLKKAEEIREMIIESILGLVGFAETELEESV